MDETSRFASRRRFLRWAAGGLVSVAGSALVGSSLLAQVGSRLAKVGRGTEFGRNRFTLARIIYPGAWDAAFPNADLNLIREFQAQAGDRFLTNMEQLTLTDPRIFQHPMLYLTGWGVDGSFGDREVDRLRRYLEGGGFLFASDCGGGGDAFHLSVLDLMEKRVFAGDSALERIPLDRDDHPMLNLVVPFGDWSPGLYLPGRFTAWEYQGRLVGGLISRFDNNCILAARAGDRRITQQALWQATNMLYYALTH